MLSNNKEVLMESPDNTDKELYTHLGLLSDEVHRIKELLGRVATRESEAKGILEELKPAKQTLAERIGHVESMIKQAAATAVSEADVEKGLIERLEQERTELVSRLKEKEAILRIREAAITELEGELNSKNEDLEKETGQKTKLLEMRDAMLANLASTTTALNLFAENLKSFDGAAIIFLDEPEQSDEDGKDARPEIEKLRMDLREKDVMLEAKEVEIASLKHTLDARIEELESLSNKRTAKKGSARLVSYFADLGHKD
jgi:chromosome segregation ATPase